MKWREKSRECVKMKEKERRILKWSTAHQRKYISVQHNTVLQYNTIQYYSIPHSALHLTSLLQWVVILICLDTFDYFCWQFCSIVEMDFSPRHCLSCTRRIQQVSLNLLLAPHTAHLCLGKPKNKVEKKINMKTKTMIIKKCRNIVFLFLLYPYCRHNS